MRYQLTRFVMMRLLGVIYVCAYYSLATQVLPLIGESGLTPARSFLDRVVEHTGSRGSAFLKMPSIFLLHLSDGMLTGLAWLGVGLSLLVMLGMANSLILFVLWALYMSFVHVGQVWYGYGWEMLLLEAGFLAIFLCPLLDPRPFPRHAPPAPVIVLFRWLALRVMLGAGLIKLRVDPCWRDLSCLDYHFETQPLPNPLSPLFHFLPSWVHRLGVLINHLCEVVLPLCVFGPRRPRLVAGVLMLGFQGILIVSGNLSFLNWLTMVPLLACLDDGLLRRLLPQRAWPAQEQKAPSRAEHVAVVILCIVIGVLSINPVINMLQDQQIMNGSFDPLGLVNTYGAFGSVGRERNEIIFEGTRDAAITGSTRWVPYEFKCKPGDPGRRPCLVSPAHYRLDWQIWFAAMSDVSAEPWAMHLVYKLLRGDPPTLDLLAANPFPDAPPRHIRAELYRYRFAPLSDRRFWLRERIGSWLPPLSLEDPQLREFLEDHRWHVPPRE